MALQDAQANTYIAILPNADYKFGLLHASCKPFAFSPSSEPLADLSFPQTASALSFALSRLLDSLPPGRPSLRSLSYYR